MHNNDSTALTTISAEEGFTQRQVEIIRKQIAPDADDDQLALFLEVCRGTGLNPFMRQIYAVFRNAKEKGQDEDGRDRWRTVKRMTIQTGIDGYRLIASRTGQLAGIDDATFDTEDADHPNRATVTVYRYSHGERVPFTATARWREYAQEKDEYRDGKPTGNKVPTEMWQRMPYLMLGKCAEALALRKAFPAELSGIYTGEEMAQADNDLPTPPTTPSPTHRPALRAVEPEPEEAIPYTMDEDEAAPEPPAADATGEPMTAKQREEMENLCKWLGKTFDASKIADTHHAAQVLVAMRKQWAAKMEEEKRKKQATQRTRNTTSALGATRADGEEIPESLESLKTGTRGV